jgi:urease accessory protein
MKRVLCYLASIAALASMPATAQAHLVDTRLGDFYGGALHPLTGLEDILPWTALAILAALQGPKRARWAAVVFPVGLLVGAACSVLLPPLSFVPGLAIALTAIVGIAVASGVTLPLPLLVALAAVVALVSGYQNGRAMTAATDQVLFVAGITLIGYAFAMLATALVVTFLQGKGAWRQIALRASGSWLAAIGIMSIGLQLFRPTL